MLQRGMGRSTVEKVLEVKVIRVVRDIEGVAIARKDEPALEDEIARETNRC